MFVITLLAMSGYLIVSVVLLVVVTREAFDDELTMAGFHQQPGQLPRVDAVAAQKAAQHVLDASGSSVKASASNKPCATLYDGQKQIVRGQVFIVGEYGPEIPDAAFWRCIFLSSNPDLKLHAVNNTYSFCVALIANERTPASPVLFMN